MRLERKEHVVSGEELFEKLVKRELEQSAIPVGAGSSEGKGPSRGSKEPAKAKK